MMQLVMFVNSPRVASQTRIVRALANSLLVLTAALQFPAYAARPFFQGLGDLHGGEFSSIANGISPDGSVVVGSSRSVNGIEAFRWSEQQGMVGLGDLPGGIF